MPQATEVKRISLLDSHVARTAKDSSGMFTMIYDEGFEVRVEGLRFFAFSAFDKNNGDTPAKKANASHCGRTARGWYRDASRTMWGCYQATKVNQGHRAISLLSVPVPELPKPSPDYDVPITLEMMQKR